MTLVEIKSRIRARINIVDFIRARGVDLKKKGRAYVACCPFHQERTPSFNVNPDGYYKCFGCGKGGDHFSFLMELDKLSFSESLEALAKMADVEIPSSFEREFRDPLAQDKKSLESLNKRLVVTFIHFYEQEKTPEAKVYLEGRGLDATIATKFDLGFLPYGGEWLKNFLITKGFSPTLLVRSGIFSAGGRFALMSERLIFPIRDLQGLVVGFGGRALAGVEPKYLNSRDDALFKKKNVLYGFYESNNHIRLEKIVVVCEGYMDVLAWHSAGVELAVAPLGTAFTYEQASLLKRFVRKVIFCFDSDKAGVTATLKSFLMAESLGLESEVVVMPAGGDPADVLQKEGATALAELYQTARQPTFDYLLDHLTRENKEKSLGQAALLIELFKIVGNNPSEVYRENKLGLIGVKLDLPQAALKRDFATWLEAGTLEHRTQRKLANRYNVGSLPPRERLLLKGVINHPQLFSLVRRYLIADDLDEEGMKVLYATIEKAWLVQPTGLTVDAIFEELGETPELKSFFLNAILAHETPMSRLDLLQTTFRIYDALLQKKRMDLTEVVQQAENRGALASMAPLMGTLQFLNRRIEHFNETRVACLAEWEAQEKQ